MIRCGRCGRACMPWLGIRGGLCGPCREQHGPWIRRSVVEFYETLTEAESDGTVGSRLAHCLEALDRLEKLEEYQRRGIVTTREPAAALRARIERCQADLQRSQRRTPPLPEARQEQEHPQEERHPAQRAPEPDPEPRREAKERGGRIDAALAAVGEIPMRVRPADLQRVVCGLAVCLAAAYFAVSVWSLRSWAADDAYISFRYARNLAIGAGLVYNRTGAPAEGYSSPPWVVLLAVPHLLGLSALAFAWGVSVLATVAYAGLAAAMARRVILRMHPAAAPLCVLVPGLLAVQGLAAIHATSGMETALYTLVVVAFQWSCMVALDEEPGRWSPVPWVGFTAGALGLMRPEGNLLVVLGGACLLALAPGSRRPSLAMALMLGWLLPVWCHEAWRTWYYGLPAPLAFYTRVLGVPVLSGLPAVTGFMLLNVSALAVPLAVGVARLDRRLAPALVGAVGFLIAAVRPDHTLSYNYRLLFPVEPLLLVVAAVGCAHLCSVGTSRFSRAVAFAASCAVVVVGMLQSCAQALPALAEARAYGAAMEEAHLPLGERLRDLRLPESSVLAIGDAGAVPYLSGWTTIDTTGLNEPHIAVNGDHSPTYVIRRKPDVLVLVSNSSRRFQPRVWWEGPLYRVATKGGWQRVGCLRFATYYNLWVLARRRTDAWRRLAAGAATSRSPSVWSSSLASPPVAGVRQARAAASERAPLASMQAQAAHGGLGR